jgi:Domain of unknown function (DUF4335)
MALLTRSISRIYTPPTCTLEVTAQPSALSRWTATPAVKSLQFLLSFEGHQGDREPIEIQGNQAQLAELATAVTHYIELLLASRASHLTVRASIASSNDSSVTLIGPPAVTSDVQIRSHSLLTHELMLGSLASESSGPSVLLKVSQLYDLASALDDYTVDFQSLALISAPTWRTALPLARSAAAVLLAVGLGATAWRLFQPGLVAVNETERSPSATTALAPPTASSSRALPPLRPQPVTPLALPTVQLPSRTPSNPAGPKAPATLAQPPQPSQSTSPSPPKLSKPSARTVPGEIALAPALPSSKSSRRLSPSTSNRLAQDQAFSQSSEASPSAPQVLARQPQSSSSSLFDSIAQVAEVRDYVAARWSPATLPPKTLEYRLTLNANGSLAQVEPLGTSAQQYLNQLSLPVAQAPFVSAVTSGGQPTIRLVLSPDGRVQTFLDRAN